MSPSPVEAVAGVSTLAKLAAPISDIPQTGVTPSFGRMLADGLGQVDRSVNEADAAVRAFALDDSLPLHQVTYALEQARLSVELMMQVRSRLLESYQELMRMQL